MEIKNKNILLNLNDNEEIFYISKIRKNDLYFVILFIILGIPLFLFFIILSFLSMKDKPWITPILIIASLQFPYFSYIYIRDYFFSELVLTNQRLIISRFNKLIFINNSQIKFINEWPYVGGPSRTYISTDTKKIYLVTNLHENILESKFKEIYPNHNLRPFKLKAGSKRDWVFCILFLLSMFCIVICFYPFSLK